MRTVLAALDASAAARPVLETATAVADLMDATVEAVHVAEREPPAETPAQLAARLGVPLRLLRGHVDEALLGALAAGDVVAAVVGARGTPGGRRPAGRTALRILQGTHKPVVVVPPEATDGTRPLRRLLVPLEGTATSSRPVIEGLCPLVGGRAELVVLHVFTAATMPRVLDRPERDLELLGAEFLARYCPPATHVELRTGPVARQISDVCRDEAIDLVVLSWSQDASPGRAAVVREVLANSTVPILLLPVVSAGAHGAGTDVATNTGTDTDVVTSWR